VRGHGRLRFAAVGAFCKKHLFYEFRFSGSDRRLRPVHHRRRAALAARKVEELPVRRYRRGSGRGPLPAAVRLRHAGLARFSEAPAAAFHLYFSLRHGCDHGHGTARDFRFHRAFDRGRLSARHSGAKAVHGAQFFSAARPDGARLRRDRRRGGLHSRDPPRAAQASQRNDLSDSRFDAGLALRHCDGTDNALGAGPRAERLHV